MPRVLKAPKPVDPLKRPPIAICDAIVRRFLKPDQNILWSREMPKFTQLWKALPSLSFWQSHELPFKLNHMSWFDSVEGKANLESAWVLFHYNPPAVTEEEALDNARQMADTPGVDDPSITPFIAPPVPPSRPRTVAEMMKSPALEPPHVLPQTASATVQSI